MNRELATGRLALNIRHEAVDEASVIGSLVVEHSRNLPAYLRPKVEELDEFARYTASALRTSFEYVEHPGETLLVDHCPCPMCALLVSLPRIRPVKPTTRDTRRADEVVVETLLALARASNMDLDRTQALALAVDAERRADLALVAWMQLAAKRMRSSDAADGAEALVLWRRFAWTPQGSPRQDFELTVDAVEAAAQRVLEAVRAA